MRRIARTPLFHSSSLLELQVRAERATQECEDLIVELRQNRAMSEALRERLVVDVDDAAEI